LAIFINESTKSGLIGEISPNLVTLAVSHFQPSLIFVGKARALRVDILWWAGNIRVPQQLA
jgi:hypothetical protein